ncbi:MAG: hypothetical protein J6T51_05825 [Kiritimatiellae bacterium]|nr:hypothetical protein [Kiritimatiellia bacterium]
MLTQGRDTRRAYAPCGIAAAALAALCACSAPAGAEQPDFAPDGVPFKYDKMDPDNCPARAGRGT